MDEIEAAYVCAAVGLANRRCLNGSPAEHALKASVRVIATRACVAALLILMVPNRCRCDDPAVTQESDQTLAEALAASARDKSGLTSGRATGNWSFTLPDGSVFARATWNLRFAEGGRYNLSIKMQERSGAASRDDVKRHILCDGNTIAYTAFAPRFHPYGCESEFRENNQNQYILATGGLEIPLERLSGIVSVQRPPGASTLVSRTTLESGDVEYRYRAESGSAAGYEHTIEVSPSAGFHVRRSTLYRKSGERALQYALNWHQFDSVWWPVEFEMKRWNPGEADKPRIQRVECATFEPNIDIDPHDFTLDALEHCGPNRLIDRRDASKVRIYDLQNGDDSSPETVPRESPQDSGADKLEDSVSKLKERYRNEETAVIPDNDHRRAFLWGLLIINAVVLLGGSLLYAFRRSRPRSPR